MNFDSNIYNLIKENRLYFKIILFSLLIVFFIHNLDYGLLKKSLLQINKGYLFLLYITFLSIPLINSLRWFLFIKKFYETSFKKIFENISEGHVVSALSNTGVAVDAYKFFFLKEKYSITDIMILIIIEKFLSIYYKLLFTIIVFNMFNFVSLNFYKYQIFLISIIFLLTLFFIDKILISVLKIKYLKKIIQKLNLSFVENIFLSIRDNFFTLFFGHFLLIFITMIGYLFVCLSLGLKSQITGILVLSNIVETISQLQFILLGLREFVSAISFQILNMDFSTSILIGFLITIFSSISIISSNLLYFALKKIQIIK